MTRVMKEYYKKMIQEYRKEIELIYRQFTAIPNNDDAIIDDMDSGYLSIIMGKNENTYVWWDSCGHEYAYNTRTRVFASEAEIIEQLR